MRRNSGSESERRKSFSVIQSHFSTDSSKANKYYNDVDESKIPKRKVYDKKKKKSSDIEKKMYQGRCESSSSDEMEYNRRGQSLDRHIIKHQKKLHSSQHDIDTTSLDHKKYKMYARKDFVSGNSKSFQQKYHSSMNYGSDYKKSSSKGSSRSRERFTPESVEMYHTDEMQRGANSSSTPDDSKSKDSSRFQIGKRLLKGEIGIKSFNYYLLKEGLKSSKKSLFKHLNTSDESKSYDNVSRSDENIYEEIYFVDKNLVSNPDCDLCIQDIQECTRKNCDICRANELMGKRAGNEKSYRDAEFPMMDQDINMQGLGQQRQNVLQYQSYNPNNPGVYKIETTPVAFTNDYNPIFQIANIPQQQSQNQPRQPYQQSQSYLNKSVRNAKSSSSSDSIHQKNFARQHVQPSFNDEQVIPSDRLDLQGPNQIHKTDSRASIISENISMRSSDNSNNYHKTAEMSDSSIGDSLFSYSAQRRFFGSSESCRFGYECRRCSYDGDKVSFSDTCRYDCRNCDCSSSYFSSDFDEINFSRNNSTRWSANMLNQDDEAGRKTKQYAQDFFKHVTNVKKKTQSQMAAEANLTVNRLVNPNSVLKENVKQQEKILPTAKSSISSASKSSSSKSSPLHDQLDPSESNRKKGAVPKSNLSKKNEKIKIEKDNPDSSDTNLKVKLEQKRASDKSEEEELKAGKPLRNNSDINQSIESKTSKDKAPRVNQLSATENVANSPKRPEWLDLEDDEVFEAAAAQINIPDKQNYVSTRIYRNRN